MKKEKDEFEGIVSASRDQDGDEAKAGDSLGLDVYLLGADEIANEDFFGSLEVWDEKIDGGRDIVCESIAPDIERIMRASRHYMQRGLETELKLKMRNNNDTLLTRDSRKFSQISKLLMAAAWLEVNERYDCWQTDTTAIRLKNGKIVIISYQDDPEDIVNDFRKFMSRGGAKGMIGGMGSLEDLKRLMDEMRGD